MISKPCYICGSERRQTVVVQAFDDPYLRLIDAALSAEPRTIAACEDCGFAYHHPTLTADEIATLYDRYRDASFRGESPDAYFDRITSIPPGRSFNYQKTTRLAPILEEKLPQKPVRSIYDIGAGGGVFLKTFLEHAPGRWEGFGVEPTPTYAELASRRLGIPVLSGLYRAGLFERSFDLITIIKVLEHAPDPIAFMRDVEKDLAEGGLVYVEVPSVKEIGSLPPQHDQVTYTHLYFYSDKTLPCIFDNAGFDMLSLEEVSNDGGDWDLIALLTRRAGQPRDWTFPLQDYREIVALGGQLNASAI